MFVRVAKTIETGESTTNEKVLLYREAGITWFRMSRNYMVSEKWSSWEVVVFPSDHF